MGIAKFSLFFVVVFPLTKLFEKFTDSRNKITADDTSVNNKKLWERVYLVFFFPLYYTFLDISNSKGGYSQFIDLMTGKVFFFGLVALSFDSCMGQI